ncbi:hypothetical protein Ahy_B08g089636 isoform B [Arachis hypogaea]|uniref:Protein FAR1-RELATED SEQUENCE n=1 Tax=Arachis hypogaea TaxID=3818 RepID=A0A444XYE2_ARAHY|nr:hypothetical protein Ahy_B08g089636 isoform B [Arachis hypogaea]
MYTHKKFSKVQVQFRGKVNCITRSTFLTQHSTSLLLHTMQYHTKCQCLLFESRGILCHHPLNTLSFERNIKRRHTHTKSSQDEPLLESKSKRFDDLVFRSHNICEVTSESEELIGILHRAFDNVMVEMQEYQAKSKGKYSLSHEDAILNDVNDLQSPPRVKTRGRPKNKLRSNMDKKI